MKRILKEEDYIGWFSQMKKNTTNYEDINEASTKEEEDSTVDCFNITSTQK
jgi:hypothetical protein